MKKITHWFNDQLFIETFREDEDYYKYKREIEKLRDDFYTYLYERAIEKYMNIFRIGYLCLKDAFLIELYTNKIFLEELFRYILKYKEAELEFWNYEDRGGNTKVIIHIYYDVT